MNQSPTYLTRIFATENPIARCLIETRALRGFADGLVAVALASYLIAIGLGARQVGMVTTATLVGSAAATIGLGMIAGRWPGRQMLLGAALLMILTGLGFLVVQDVWLLIPVAFIGTMNPSNGDVSVFLPLEQAGIAGEVSGASRTSVFARYSLGANLAASLGALAAGGIATVVANRGMAAERTGQIGFLVYTLIGVIVFLRLQGLPRAETINIEKRARSGLHQSRAIVTKMAVVFSLDSLGGGFVVQTMLILWLHQRHGMTEAAAGLLFAVSSLLAAFSMLVAAPMARRIGLVNTMVFTHLPANIFLILTPFMPTMGLAVTMLLGRALLSSMDVPARTAFVMAAVQPDERPAAASYTNVPRSLASAVSPALAGQLLSMTAFGWPLVIGGVLKASYDLILLGMFRSVQIDPD
ncbi:MAG TPA: MFS transporter [Thermomicrobiales bacterium]|mgnify:CR=1 FL=1|nr:MFS transporter [Thermomicrobiales bacterium]HRA46646.1 MFS transporter [Thermomicrobiales bacterium]